MENVSPRPCFLPQILFFCLLVLSFTLASAHPASSGGLVDVAETEFGLKRVEANTDQAFARLGLHSGSYVYLPFAGPSTVRGTFGKVMDTLLNPSWLAGFVTSTGVGLGAGGVRKLNDISFTAELENEIDEMALDPYVSIRDAYFQYTEGRLKENDAAP